MPIELWKTKHGTWYWTCTAPNGGIIGDSGEGYTSRAKALQGLTATAQEMVKWHAAQQSRKSSKKTTLGHQKPAGKPSTSSSSRTRKTVKRGA